MCGSVHEYICACARASVSGWERLLRIAGVTARGAACSNIDTRPRAKTFGGLEGGGGWEGAPGECKGGFRVVSRGGDQVTPNSWVVGYASPGSRTHAPPLPKEIGCHRLGYFRQWVPKISGGSVLRRSWGGVHNMGFAIQKGVELSWGEVCIMRSVVYKGVGKARNFEGEGFKNSRESKNREGCFPKEECHRSGTRTPSGAACNPHKWSKRPIVPFTVLPATASASPHTWFRVPFPFPKAPALPFLPCGLVWGPSTLCAFA